jgi:hypothetical protein
VKKKGGVDDPLAPMRRFAKPIQDGFREPDPFLCRHLRTKTWYVPDSFAERDISRSSPTAQYWCLKTMRADGPDGALALPEDCTDERVCFDPALAKVGDS